MLTGFFGLKELHDTNGISACLDSSYREKENTVDYISNGEFWLN